MFHSKTSRVNQATADAYPETVIPISCELITGKMYCRQQFIFAVSTLLLIAVRCAAFQIPIHHARTGRHVDTKLGVAEKRPRWTDLPRERKTRPELSGYEINTGRLAMIGFCGLLVREVVSGESFGEQIVHAFSSTVLTNLPI